MSNIVLNQLVKQLEAVQKEDLWMGQNFAEKFSQITETEAFTCPREGIHSVAQIIAHLTAWKKDALLKIRDGQGKLTDEDKENWPENEALKSLGWNKVKTEFEKVHQELVTTLSGLDDQLLEKKYYDQDYKKECSIVYLLEGLVHHNLYHLGQIGLVIRMIK